MVQQEIDIIKQYFMCYKKGKYCSYLMDKSTEAEHYFHKEEDFFHLIIFPTDNSVFQLDTDHKCFGIELKTLRDFEIRFESITGNKLNYKPKLEEPLELSYEERVNLLNEKRKAESTSQFINPGVYTTEPGPSEEYLDLQGIPRIRIIKDLNDGK